MGFITQALTDRLQKGICTCFFLFISSSLFSQQVEHYTGHGCDCYIYPGGPDSTKTYTPTHDEIDSAEFAIKRKMAMKNPPNNMYDLVSLGLDNFERHYHGTISQKGKRELRIHGVNKSNTNEVWVTYYSLYTDKLYDFILYGSH
jgi:hypothetical protein